MQYSISECSLGEIYIGRNLHSKLQHTGKLILPWPEIMLRLFAKISTFIKSGNRKLWEIVPQLEASGGVLNNEIACGFLVYTSKRQPL